MVSIGFGLGGLFLYAADKTLPHMHFGPNHETEGFPSHLKRTILLVFSITLHNIPEGLAVGVAFEQPPARKILGQQFWQLFQ